MEVTYHIGAHATEGDRLLACLRANADGLSRKGVAVAPPDRFRPAAREAMLAARGLPGSADSQTALLAAMGVCRSGQGVPGRLVLSSESLLCVPRRAVEEGEIYPIVRERARWMRALFPDAGARICVAVRNPATWLADVHARFRDEVSFAEWLGSVSLPALSWARYVAALHEAVPDAEIVIWCHEDAPLLWRDILAAMVEPQASATDLETVAERAGELLPPAAAARLEAYLATCTDDAARHEARIAFLDRFAPAEATTGHLHLPMPDGPAIARMAQEITERYERDVAALGTCGEVTLLRPRTVGPHATAPDPRPAHGAPPA